MTAIVLLSHLFDLGAFSQPAPQSDVITTPSVVFNSTGIDVYSWLTICGYVILWAIYAVSLYLRQDRVAWLKRRRSEIALLVLSCVFTIWSPPAAAVCMTALLVVHFTRVYIVLTEVVARPSQLLASSFLLMIVIGMFALKMPGATPASHPIGWLDALFTSTSAVCVTGLIVRDTATEFTRLGQGVILILIQLGGLGIVMFGALVASMLGRAISLKHTVSIGDAMRTSEGGWSDVNHLIRFVVFATLTTEIIGAVIVYVCLGSQTSGSDDLIFISLFLSISAFCNAGFAPFSDSLISIPAGGLIYPVIGLSIILGGIGFPVLYNIGHVGWSRFKVMTKLASNRQINQPHLVRLNLHTKIVLLTTVCLIILGGVGLYIGQLMGDQQGLIIVDSLFMSVSARTAGFNSLDMDALSPASRFVLMLLMWVGGSPGSTAGGVKTVAIAVLALTIWATIRGRSSTEVFSRTIPESIVRRSGVLAGLGLLTCAASTFALTCGGTVSDVPLSDIIFEAVSAASTVGLSVGVTELLTPFGKIVIIITMILGRIGPLTVLGVLVFGAATRNVRVYYPEETVVIS